MSSSQSADRHITLDLCCLPENNLSYQNKQSREKRKKKIENNIR